MKHIFRTMWISDTHLGTRGCQSALLLDLLEHTKMKQMYLVGDIIDGWAMSAGRVYWPQEHTNVIRQVLSKSRSGTEVIYISGNHDEFLRKYDFHKYGNVFVNEEAIHTTADGREFLVIHGDQFDIVTRYHKWIAKLGDIGYRFLIRLNVWLNKLRARWGKGYWSLSKYIKHRVKQAVNFIGEFEESVARSCRKRGMDGVICGHIHHPEIREIDGVLYINDGDFVESCSALVEDFDGKLMLIEWKGSDKAEPYVVLAEA